MFPLCSRRDVLPRLAALAVAAAGLLALPAVAAPERLDGPVPAILVRVIDGDTILVRARIWLGQEVETRVRLAGINAPELHARDPAERARAEAARRFLAEQLAPPAAAAGGPAAANGSLVPLTLHAVERDKYGGRVVARVRAPDGADLSALLLEAGLARPYRLRRAAARTAPGPAPALLPLR